MLRATARLPLVLPLLALWGCAASTPAPKSSSPLKPTQMTPDSVALEVFSIRVPQEKMGLVARVWDEADEQCLSAELRSQLSKRGFRVGVLGSQISSELSTLMELKESHAMPTDGQHIRVDQLQADVRVVPRHLQTRAGQRSEIVTSCVFDQMPVLVTECGELRGVTYQDAQGVFALVADPQSDGRVRLELTPEIQHGQNRQHWVGDQAMFRLETGRPKRSFAELKITAELAAGSMLLLGSQSDRTGSLGHYFFMDTSGRDDRREPKLILVRLCQTQHDDLLAPPPLSLAK